MTRKEEQLRKAMLHYLEGSIHPEELEVLNRAVETDPQARREMAELMLQDALLTKVGQETEFFELDEPRPVPPAAVSCRTSRIMKITRRAPPAEAPAPKPSIRRGLIAAAAILFAVSVATAVTVLRPAESDPATTTVMPIVPPAPAAVAPPEEPAAETPAKAVVNAPAAPKSAPSKAKAPAAKPKTSTARKELPESRPQTTNVPDGFLSLPPSKTPPPSPSKPAPKLPPKPPPPPPPAQK